MPTMSKEEYEKSFGRVLPEPPRDPIDPEVIAKEEVERDWVRRVHQRGYIFDANGLPWLVPGDLVDLYREKYPDLGTGD